MKRDEKLSKFLLDVEIIIGIISTVWFLTTICVAAYIIETFFSAGIILLILAFVCYIPSLIVLVKIEQVAGHYVCPNCGHKHIPTTKNIWLSAHMGRTRYLKCPKCGEKSWNKKTL